MIQLHCISIGHRAILAMRWSVGSAVLVTGAFALPGCGTDDEGRRPVTGTVSIDDQMIPRGSISFFPERGHSGPAAATSISEGVYRFTKTNGPTAGHHRVVIGVETNPEGIKDVAPGTPGSSATAKQGPGPSPLERTGGQAGSVVVGQSQWTTSAVVPSAEFPEADDAINFSLRRDTKAVEADSSTENLP